MKTSASCRALGTWMTRSSPTATFSLTKWMSSSMCLVRRWWTGFRDMYTEDILSQNATVAVGTLQSSSPRSCRSQEHSATALAIARYSASALDQDTVVCRLDDHEMSEEPRKTQNPDVDRRVSGQPAQSASE